MVGAFCPYEGTYRRLVEGDFRCVKGGNCERVIAGGFRAIALLTVSIHRIGRASVRTSVPCVNYPLTICGAVNVSVSGVTIRTINMASKGDHCAQQANRVPFPTVPRHVLFKGVACLRSNDLRHTRVVRGKVICKVSAVRTSARTRRVRLHPERALSAYKVTSVTGCLVQGDLLRFRKHFLRRFCLPTYGAIRLLQVTPCRVQRSKANGRDVLSLRPFCRPKRVLQDGPRTIRANVRLCISKRIYSAFLFHFFGRDIRRVRTVCFKLRLMVRRNLRDDRLEVRSGSIHDSTHFTRFKTFINGHRNGVVSVVFLRDLNCLVEAYAMDKNFRRTSRLYFQLRLTAVVIRVNGRHSGVGLRGNFIRLLLRCFHRKIGARLAYALGRGCFIFGTGFPALGNACRNHYVQVGNLLCVGTYDTKECFVSCACSTFGTATICRLYRLSMGYQHILANLRCVQGGRDPPRSLALQATMGGVRYGVR